MPQSLVNIPVHLVFSTQKRIPFLQDPTERNRLHQYMHGICRNLGSPALRINGPADHVHVLCSLNKQQEVSSLVRQLKACSSKWFREQHGKAMDFHWQAGYGAFAVSPDGVARTIEYIEQQEAHHRGVTFQDEFRRFCKEAGVDLDERYVWE